MSGPQGEFIDPTSFENIDLTDLLDKMRTFSLIGGPHHVFSGPTYFEITILMDLLNKMRTFSRIKWSNFF